MVLATFNSILACNLCLPYLMMARMGGNPFMMGILLALAEAAAAIVTGIGLNHMRDVNVVRLCAITAVIFNTMYYYFASPDHALLSYIVFFIGMLGQNGPYNVSYVIFELRIPPKNLGSANSIIILFFGPLAMTAMPFVAI